MRRLGSYAERRTSSRRKRCRAFRQLHPADLLPRRSGFPCLPDRSQKRGPPFTRTRLHLFSSSGTTTSSPPTAGGDMRTALVLGGGGVPGVAYHAAVLAALENDLGWDARSAQVIVGTSAGAIVGSLPRAGARPLDPAGLPV